MASIERIKSKSSAIKDKRQKFYEKLEELKNALSEALGGIDVYAKSVSSSLEEFGSDEWVYGYLYYSKEELKVAYRTTEDDFEDAMNNIPKEYQSYRIKELPVCPIEWLEVLSSKNSINSLMNNIELALDSIEDNSTESFGALEQALDFQSDSIFNDAENEIKNLNDENLHRDWLKARSLIHTDPADSMTRTSSFLESVCRKIHADLSCQLPSRQDISPLIASTIRILDIAEDSEAKRDLTQLFGGIKGVVKAIGALRTHFGTAHGTSPGDFEIGEHHARLLNDSAGAVSVFLFKLYKMKLNK